VTVCFEGIFEGIAPPPDDNTNKPLYAILPMGHLYSHPVSISQQTDPLNSKRIILRLACSCRILCFPTHNVLILLYPSTPQLSFLPQIIRPYSQHPG